MIGMPLTGWLMVSASKTADPDPALLDVVPWPNIPGVDGLAPAAKHIWRTHRPERPRAAGLGLLRPLRPARGRRAEAPAASSRDDADPAAHGAGRGRRPLVGAAPAADRAGGRRRASPSASWCSRRARPSARRRPTQAAGRALPARDARPRRRRRRGARRGARRPPRPRRRRAAATGAASPGRSRRAPASTSRPAGAATPVQGRFNSWKADILFGPDALDKSKVTVTIDMTSAKTGDEQRDASLPAGRLVRRRRPTPRRCSPPRKFEKTGEDALCRPRDARTCAG